MDRPARAVVCRALNEPVVVEDIVVEGPRRNEVTIKLAACGVCHSECDHGAIAIHTNVHVGAIFSIGFAINDTVCGILHMQIPTLHDLSTSSWLRDHDRHDGMRYA